MGDLDAAELEHVIGFSGQHNHALTAHPLDPNIILHGIGHVVVIADQVRDIPASSTALLANSFCHTNPSRPPKHQTRERDMLTSHRQHQAVNDQVLARDAMGGAGPTGF